MTHSALKIVERNDAWGNWFEIETSDPTEIYMGVKMVDGVLYCIDGNYIAYQPEYKFSDVMVRITSVDSNHINQLLAGQFGAQYGQYPVGSVCHACEGSGRSAYDERRPCSVCDGEGVLCDDVEDDICSVCGGSGEGQYDGTRCKSCKGSGVEKNA